MDATTDVLVTAVDAVTAQDLAGLSTAELQAQVAVVAPLVQRLEAFLALAAAQLSARTGGRLATEDGGSRSVAGWMAEVSGDSPAAAGRAVRTANALQEALPRVALAVLDGRVPWVRAQVLTRLVGRVDAEALWEAQDALLTTAQQLDPVQLG